MVVEKGPFPVILPTRQRTGGPIPRSGPRTGLRRAGYTLCDGADVPLPPVEGENDMAITEPEEKPARVLRPDHGGARVTVLLQPEETRLSLPRPKTARQLLEALNLAEETALVARNGELLTPDRRIWPDDELLVRKVASSG